MLVYYFKTKDDIIAAVVQVHVDQLEAAFATLERAHRSTKARLKALVGVVAEQARSIASSAALTGLLVLNWSSGPMVWSCVLLGLCRFVSAGSKSSFTPSDGATTTVWRWSLLQRYQRSAVLTSTLGQPEVMGDQARRLERSIDALTTSTDELWTTARREGSTHHD